MKIIPTTEDENISGFFLPCSLLIMEVMMSSGTWLSQAYACAVCLPLRFQPLLWPLPINQLAS